MCEGYLEENLGFGSLFRSRVILWGTLVAHLAWVQFQTVALCFMSSPHSLPPLLSYCHKGQK